MFYPELLGIVTEVRRKAIGRAYVWRCALIQSTSSNLNSQGCVQLLMSFRYWCYPEQEQGSCCRLVEVVNGGDTELVTKLIRKDRSDSLHFFLVLPLSNPLQARFYSFFCQAHPCLSVFRGTSCLNLNSLVLFHPFVSKMLASGFFCLLASSYLVYSAPIITGVKLDPAATAEAQQRDDAATRAFTAAQIKVGS